MKDLRRCYTVQFFVRLVSSATPFLQTFSYYETNCFTSVTLSNISCNLSRFDDHVRLQERFLWLVPQTFATQVAGQMLRMSNA